MFRRFNCSFLIFLTKCAYDVEPQPLIYGLSYFLNFSPQCRRAANPPGDHHHRQRWHRHQRPSIRGQGQLFLAGDQPAEGYSPEFGRPRQAYDPYDTEWDRLRTWISEQNTGARAHCRGVRLSAVCMEDIESERRRYNRNCGENRRRGGASQHTGKQAGIKEWRGRKVRDIESNDEGYAGRRKKDKEKEY